MNEDWPQRLVPHNSHYLIHLVTEAKIGGDDILRFEFARGDGTKYRGPFFCSLVNGEKPDAARILQEHRLSSPSEIHYVVVYHSGAFPNGHPTLLLNTLDDPRLARLREIAR